MNAWLYAALYSCFVTLITLFIGLYQSPKLKKRGEGRKRPSPTDLFLVLLFSLLGGWIFLIYCFIEDLNYIPYEPPSPFRVATEDLIEQVSIESVEAQSFIRDPLGAVPSLPFGHLNHAWETFKEKALPNNELWSFKGGWVDEFEETYSLEGYVLVAEDGPGDFFFTP